MSRLQGGFTLPGEAGYEDLTLKMADKWGADVIRDSDGTKLSDEILEAGYGIYSTICVIRDHNEWAKQHPDKQQQTFLMTPAAVAPRKEIEIPLLESFFTEQFQINASQDSLRYWQVYDRTTDREIDHNRWVYDAQKQAVRLLDAEPFHSYTVSFLAYRIWEEISMYNHTANHWDKEHLMQIDPVYPETQEYLLQWMEDWCQKNPDTTVVRFTSLFYNFVWIWGADERNRNLFTDWGSYDFTVSPCMLDLFYEKSGYSLCAEDFINQGKLQVTHMPATQHKRDYMEFINRFVLQFAKKLIKIVHDHGKKAYVFYDDSWVGLEPYSPLFPEFGFDGIIKCVFSGFEVRLCAGVKTETHEIRLHPYLFPIGLGGAPTFMAGGNPTLDAKQYWLHVRRGLLREPIQRIGLGGYLHLTENFPDFQDYIEKISDEFRVIKQYHALGHPYVFRPKIAVLHYWGKLRSWTLSGHFHETCMHDLIHVNEALSGLPFDVDFIDFEDVRNGKLDNYDVVINAGKAGTAWSGGESWKQAEIVSSLIKWSYNGGVFIGIGEPSAVNGFEDFFRMAPVLGVDEDTGSRVCHGKWKFRQEEIPGLLPEGCDLPDTEDRFLTDGTAEVLISKNGNPKLALHKFGKGSGVYMSGYRYSTANVRLLLNILLYVTGIGLNASYITSNENTECSCFPEAHKLIIANNSDQEQETTVQTEKGQISCTIPAFDEVFLDI